MKKLNKSLLAAAVAFTMCSGAAVAQQKVGVINVQDVFQSLPQAATIQQTITAEFKDQIEEVNRMEKDLQYYMEKQKRDTATMSQEEIKELEGKIIALRDEYAAKAQPLQQTIQRRTAEERNKLLALIKQSVDKLAADGEYDVVLNSNAVVYIDQQFDLSQSVIDQVSKTN
ncbi:MAG: OmpH family outer membrane protein [Aestuariibacter sp.]